MDAQLFFALLNPAVGLFLSGAFFLLWSHRRKHRYLVLIAAGYAFYCIGFLLRDVVGVESATRGLLFNSCFLLAGFSVATAILARYGCRPPLAGFLLIFLGGTAALYWFHFIEPHMPGRVFAINMPLAVLFTLVAAILLRVRKETFPDRVIFAFLLVVIASFVIRPFLMAPLVAPYETYSDFRLSEYWIATQVSQALVSSMLAMALMVAAALDLITELRTESHTDTLSGLRNRRGFEEKAESVLRSSFARNLPVALLVADLDHFKRINDTLGHVVGDGVIVAFGRLLGAAAGTGMVSGRIGGEEFAVLMPGAGAAEARAFAEKIRCAFRAAAIDGITDDLRPTVSVGIHIAAAGTGDLSSLVRHADGALYDAKRSGRDCVRVSGDATTTADPLPVPKPATL